MNKAKKCARPLLALCSSHQKYKKRAFLGDTSTEQPNILTGTSLCIALSESLNPSHQQTAEGPHCAENRLQAARTVLRTDCRQRNLRQHRNPLIFTDRRRNSVELQKTQMSYKNVSWFVADLSQSCEFVFCQLNVVQPYDGHIIQFFFNMYFLNRKVTNSVPFFTLSFVLPIHKCRTTLDIWKSVRIILFQKIPILSGVIWNKSGPRSILRRSLNDGESSACVSSKFRRPSNQRCGATNQTADSSLTQL